MKERPILFSTEMVRAILDGRKTQTRRVVKNQPPSDTGRIFVEKYEPCIFDRYGESKPGKEIFGAYNEDGDWGIKFPFGEIGDRLWVREAFLIKPNGEYFYKADDPCANGWQTNGIKTPFKPSIFMPREASRITLEIKYVRVERLNDISEIDAIKEGIKSFDSPVKSYLDYHSKQYYLNPIYSFKTLWESINGPESWEQNPYVWVIEFDRVNA